MSNRLTTVLLALITALAIGEFISSIIIWRENYPDAQPWFAVAFGVLYLGALWLVRTGRTAGGAALSAVLFLFEVISFPSWEKHGTADWVFDSVYAALSLAGFLAAVAVLVTGISARRRVSR